jgi:hypothetical protein
MAAVVIPIDSTLGKQSFTTILDGIELDFELLNNSRGDYWTMNIYSSAGDLLAAGVRLVTNWPLMLRNTDERLPPGQMMLIDMTGAGTEANYDALGTTHVLMYQEAA